MRATLYKSMQEPKGPRVKPAWMGLRGVKAMAKRLGFTVKTSGCCYQLWSRATEVKGRYIAPRTLAHGGGSASSKYTSKAVKSGNELYACLVQAYKVGGQFTAGHGNGWAWAKAYSGIYK